MKKRTRGSICLTAVFPALAFILIYPSYALANQQPPPPGRGSALSLLVEVVLLIGLTLASGGYGILRRMDASKSKFSRVLKNAAGIILGTLVFLFGFTNVGAALFAITVFSIYGIIRGVQMIKWGRAAKALSRPAHLEGVNSKKLLASGILLLILTPVVFGYGFVSIGESQQPYVKRGHATMINTEAKSAYGIAQSYLAANPGAKTATCSDMEKAGYKIPAGFTCYSDITVNSGGITITGPESWGLSNPSATVSYSGDLIPARP